MTIANDSATTVSLPLETEVAPTAKITEPLDTDQSKNTLVTNQQITEMDTDGGERQEGQKAKFRQFYSASVAHLGALIMATVWSYSSTALPSLRETGGAFTGITIWDEAWIASITFLAGAVGSFATGYIAQVFGLKRSLVIASVPLFIGWTMITCAPNMAVILVGRFITGFFVAGVGVSGSLIAELSNPTRRGRLNFLFDMLFCVGVLLIYIVGSFFSWKIQAGICAAICLLFFGLLLTIPESPLHLIRNGNEVQAKKDLRWIRDRQNIDFEFNELKRSVEELEAETKRSPNQNWTNQLKSYYSNGNIKPIVLAIALQFFLQVCGVVPIVCYAVDVFKTAGDKGVHENVSTVILGVVNLVATCVAYFFVDNYGRRKLFFGSEVCLTVTLAVLGAFLYLRNSVGVEAFQTQGWSWFPLVCFVIYIAGYSFGVGPLPWVIIGEILPPNIKGFANGISTLAARVFGFFVMFFFKDMIIVIGQHGVYWFFAVICFLGMIFCYFFIPETKNRSLPEVQRIIQGSWLHHNDRRSVCDENIRPNGHV